MTSSTRELIVASADELFYRQGYEHTSFAHIASDVNISRGNFYHHFKTKDDILDAVIERRINIRQQMIDHWESQETTPIGKISRFIRVMMDNRAKIILYGCPLGTLSNEMAKLDHASRAGAAEVMQLFRRWLASQFAEMVPLDRADNFALQVLGWSQGVATIANAFQDEEYIRNEVARMEAWLHDISKTASN